MCSYCEPLIKAIDAYISKADDKLKDQLGEEGYIKPKETLKHAQEIEDEVAEALVDETDYFIKSAEKAVDLKTYAKKVWPGVKINDPLRAKLVKIFKERFSAFMPDFIGYYIQQTDRDLFLEQVSKRTTAWVVSWSEQLAEIMQLNSGNQIEKILTDGLKEGQGIAEFTRQIRESGIRDEYYRARTVAVTEVLRAHSVAQQEAYMQSPAVESKSWKHTGAHKNEPRENHVDMDGQTVPKNSVYTLIGADGETYYPMYPRDPILPVGETANCHCISQPIVSEEILGLSLEERKRLQQEAIDEADDGWEKELDAKNKARAGITEE